MGFASFGSKPNPPKKKRKIAGADPNSEGSGSNSMPLGVRLRAVGVGEGANGGASVLERWDEGEGVRDQYDLVQRPSGGEVVDLNDSLVRSGVDSDRLGETGRLATEGEQYNLGPDAFKGFKPEAPNVNLVDMQAGMQKRDTDAVRVSQAGGRKDDGSWDWQALRRGVRDERGDTAFYNENFVEDPWRDLQEAGNWIGMSRKI